MATEGYPDERNALKPGNALVRAGADLIFKKIEDPTHEEPNPGQLSGTGVSEPKGLILPTPTLNPEDNVIGRIGQE